MSRHFLSAGERFNDFLPQQKGNILGNASSFVFPGLLNRHYNKKHKKYSKLQSFSLNVYTHCNIETLMQGSLLFML